MDDALLENEDLSDIESVTEDIGMIEYRRFKNYITPYNTKSMDWCLYDRDLRHERVNISELSCSIC